MSPVSTRPLQQLDWRGLCVCFGGVFGCKSWKWWSPSMSGRDVITYKHFYCETSNKAGTKLTGVHQCLPRTSYFDDFPAGKRRKNSISHVSGSVVISTFKNTGSKHIQTVSSWISALVSHPGKPPPNERAICGDLHHNATFVNWNEVLVRRLRAPSTFSQPCRSM